MQQWVRLVKVETYPMVQVPPVIVTSPKIEQVHRSTHAIQMLTAYIGKNRATVAPDGVPSTDLFMPLTDGHYRAHIVQHWSIR